jgi:class 3 adenylate cyclase
MGGLAIVVFSDLVDSTALLARLGDDRMEQIRRAHVQDVTGVVDAAGGRVIKTLGDEISDMVALTTAPCACGRPLARMVSLQGRSDDIRARSTLRQTPGPDEQGL